MAALLEHGDEAKLLAGGMSLLPLMKLRLAVPGVLVDVGGLRELSYVRDEGDHLAVGALTRHHDLERHELVSRHCGLLAAVATRVGDPQVRHRGTLGGSVAHGDPASDLPAALMALDATVVITGADGDRDVDAADFFHGFLDTALGPEELLREVRIPKSDRGGFAFEKFQRRAQDWAIVGAAVAAPSSAPSESGEGWRVGLVNMGPTPIRARATEEALDSGATPHDAAALASEGSEPPADLHASPEFREHLARVLVERAVEASLG